MHRDENTVGVIVGRLQVPELHAGHRYLLETVRGLHTEVCVVLGSTEAELTEANPLWADVRRVMLQNRFPGIVVCELFDRPSDEAWSAALDDLIAKIFPGRAAILYGSRGSFIPHYHGRFPTHEVKELYLESGTQMRNAAGTEPRDSEDFRIGLMYAAHKRRPIVYPTVDLVVLNTQERTALLGRRAADGGKYRFMGGFVDPTDLSLEAAVRREKNEEFGTNLELSDYRILGTARIDDPRYRHTADSIMTTFFAADRIFGL